MPREEQMVWHIMAHSDSRGSDVRLNVGQLMRPDRTARHSIDPKWWRWKVKFGFTWKRPEEHINVKEARVAPTVRHVGSRFLLVMDSAVGIVVLSTHRSSSYKLQRVCRKFSAIELAAQLRPVFAFIRSTLNPADRPSRRPHDGTTGYRG